MNIRITVAFRGLAPSEAVQSEIVLHAKQLERVDADIVLCHVYLERRDADAGDRYHVDVHLTMRGGDTLATRPVQDESLHADVHEALRLAFEDVAEQLAATRFRRYQPRRRERGAAPGW